MNKVLPPRQVPILTEVVQFEDQPVAVPSDAPSVAPDMTGADSVGQVAGVPAAHAPAATPTETAHASEPASAPPAAAAPPVAAAASPATASQAAPSPPMASPAHVASGATAALVPAAATATELPPVPPPAFLLAGSQEQIAHRVLTDLQRQIDSMLEYRLRETLTPALARMSDQLIRETRIELADTLRDVIARAVAQELARTRDR